MAVVYIAFGSNLGDRNKNIQDAMSFLVSHPDIKVKNISSTIETEPQGGPPQAKFLNGAVKIETDLSPQGLLEVLKKIEADLGRKQTPRNSPRPIDLDIIFYGGNIIDTSDLKIPHPRMHPRQL